jgi:hypothetical protein
MWAYDGDGGPRVFGMFGNKRQTTGGVEVGWLVNRNGWGAQ